MGRHPFASIAKLKPWVAFGIVALLAAGVFFYITKRPAVPGWFKYDPAKPYEIFDAWRHLTTRKAAVAVGPNWNVLGGILTDEWNRPLANTPIRFRVSSRFAADADLVTDARGYFLAYGPYYLEMDAPYKPPGTWERIVARLPNRLVALFSRKGPPGIVFNMDSSGVSACPGYPATGSGRAFAESRKELRICTPELLMKDNNRAFYHFIVKRRNTFTRAGLATFEKSFATNDVPGFVNFGRSPLRKREGPTEGRARNVYQICVQSPEGEPVPKALVKFRSYDGVVDNQQTVETDENGRAELEEWLLTGKALEHDDGHYLDRLERSLQIAADSLVVGPIEFSLSTNSLNVVKLKQAASIAGKVEYEGNASWGGGVGIYYTRHRLADGSQVQFHRDGSFRCENVMPDEPFRLLGRFGYENAPVEIALSALKPGEARTNIIIKTVQPAALRGIITDSNGAPVKVTAWNIDLEINGQRKMFGEGEQFGFQGIGGEPFQIRVQAKDHLQYLSDPMQLEPGEVRFVKIVLQINPGKLAVKPLRAWLEDLGKYGGEPYEWAQDAVRKMGTNALPELFTLWYSTNEHEQELSSRGLETLGKLARPAIPDLLRIVQDTGTNESSRLKERALHVLADIKAEDAAPVLIKLIEANKDDRIEDTAIWAVGRIGKQPETAVPVIMKILAGGRQEYRISCIYALGDFGADATPALPLILKSLEDGGHFTRSYASNALREIDPQFARDHGVP